MVKVEKRKNPIKAAKRKWRKNSIGSIITGFTALLNNKTKQTSRRAQVSSRRGGVGVSQESNTKKLMLEKRKPKKKHHRVKFTRSSQNCEHKTSKYFCDKYLARLEKKCIKNGKQMRKKMKTVDIIELCFE